MPAAQGRFRLGNGIVFEHQSNALAEDPGDARQGDARHPEQHCAYVRDDSGDDYDDDDDDDQRSLLYMTEYKARHELPDAYLRSGLQPVNMWEDVVQRRTISADANGKLQYNAERHSYVALMQAFVHMIQDGLEYGCLTNGRMPVIAAGSPGRPDDAVLHLNPLEMPDLPKPKQIIPRFAVRWN
jgi:hypothetical protein